VLERLRHTVKTWKGLVLIPALYWRHVRRYEFEVCHRCGHPVGLVWRTSDDLWRQVMGHSGGVLCVRCFDQAADVYWQAVEPW
jgi:hypothetical protein